MEQVWVAGEREEVVASLKVLGTLLRTKPSDVSLSAFFEMLEQEKLREFWPVGGKGDEGDKGDVGNGGQLEGGLDEVQGKLLSHARDKELDLLWQAMFVGPNHLTAPPWGSVYLDHEQVVFGDSCVELGFFLKSLGLVLDTGMHEPEDHMGLMCWYVAALLEANRDEELTVLLGEHVLPWAYRYTGLLGETAVHPFFEGMAALVEVSFKGLQKRYDVMPLEKRIYF